ncbi:MAG: thiamine-phosphate kinase [Candidatus Aminicenantales bacterium]
MSETLADIGEFGLIRRIRNLIEEASPHDSSISVGLGDDTASIIPSQGYEMLLTCDCLVEGRHFLSQWIEPFDIGRRAMVVNISDIGAMGGLPRFALISLGLKPSMLVSAVEEMYRGFLEELKPFGGSIIGGNITRSNEKNFIDITLIGEVEKGKILHRSGARSGDSILVTGYPGEAAAGLEILRKSKPEKGLKDNRLVRAYSLPSHRAWEGRAVARSGIAHAMIDTSDGFLGDLGHICEESHVGAELTQEKFPLSETLKKASQELAADPVELFLGESDDYELIIICPPSGVDDIEKIISEVSQVPVTEVGRITDKAGVMRIILPDGTGKLVFPSGWNHFSD